MAFPASWSTPWPASKSPQERRNDQNPDDQPEQASTMNKKKHTFFSFFLYFISGFCYGLKTSG
jgi:hypothetical protein